MKRVETLSGKNLPRLAVAKPGWPESIYRLATDEENEIARTQLREGNRMAKEVAIARGVKLHPRLAALRSTITPKAIEDFTRVCDQTGLSEKLRKD